MLYRYVDYLLEEHLTSIALDHGPIGAASIGSLSAILMLFGDARKLASTSHLPLVKSNLHECGFRTSHTGFLHVLWLSHVPMCANAWAAPELLTVHRTVHSQKDKLV